MWWRSKNIANKLGYKLLYRTENDLATSTNIQYCFTPLAIYFWRKVNVWSKSFKHSLNRLRQQSIFHIFEEKKRSMKKVSFTEDVFTKSGHHHPPLFISFFLSLKSISECSKRKDWPNLGKNHFWKTTWFGNLFFLLTGRLAETKDNFSHNVVKL